MVSEADRNYARQRSQKKHNKCISLDSKIVEWKAPSGSKLFIVSEVRLDIGNPDQSKTKQIGQQKEGTRGKGEGICWAYKPSSRSRVD